MSAKKIINDFSEEELEILDYFERDEVVRPQDADERIAEARIAASNFKKKSERINIRLTQFDLTQIKKMASRDGLPYQTLISSVLHKYAAGYLKSI